MNNPFDYVPDDACRAAFGELTVRLDALKKSVRPDDILFCNQLEAGKMLGVSIAEDKDGRRHTLYAFSGQVGDLGFYFPGFVGPVFDYLRPDGYFKTQERDISRRNQRIAEYESCELASAQRDYESEKQRLSTEIESYQQECRRAKTARKMRRDSGLADEAELATMIRQSQFEKAELRRKKNRMSEALEPYAVRVKGAEARLFAMKESRRIDSENLQRWLFDNFRLLNAKGESRSLMEIFAETSLKVPPSGAGECCAPKLLQAAYLRGWRPVSIAEYWYGAPKNGEIRRHGEHYPACRGKCLPVLSWMLQGLEVVPPVNSEAIIMRTPEPKLIFENEWFCVVDKPAGMLSVPGKGPALSVQRWLENHYGPERSVKLVHRLDQDTSGLLIAAFGEESYKLLQRGFAKREVRKTYVAILEGDYRDSGLPEKGRIELPLSPDWLDRPRQRVDFESGKEAVSEYEFVSVEDGRSRIVFHPLTGRTHQLRMHSASERGLGLPIVGDRLYGSVSERMMLHAHKIEFVRFEDNKTYSFESPLPF